MFLRTISFNEVIFTYHVLPTTVHQFNLCHCLWVDKLTQNHVHVYFIHLTISHLTVPPPNIAKFSNITRVLSLLPQPNNLMQENLV